MIRLKLRNMKISHHIFIFKFILLSIFYSSSLYHSTNVIMLLDSFFHVAETLKPIDVIRLELQSLKVAEMLSPLMLWLELQKNEDKSLYFIFKFILLNIFYLLLFYRWMQVILISYHYLIIMDSLILH